MYEKLFIDLVAFKGVVFDLLCLFALLSPLFFFLLFLLFYFILFYFI